VVVLVDIIEKGEAEMYGGGDTSQGKGLWLHKFRGGGRLWHLVRVPGLLHESHLPSILQALCPIRWLPSVPVAEGGDEAMSEAVVAYAGVGFVKGELTLGLSEEAFMVGYEVGDFGA